MLKRLPQGCCICWALKKKLKNHAYKERESSLFSAKAIHLQKQFIKCPWSGNCMCLAFLGVYKFLQNFHTVPCFKCHCRPHALQDSACSFQCTLLAMTNTLGITNEGDFASTSHNSGRGVCRTHCTLATLAASSSHNLFNMFTF